VKEHELKEHELTGIMREMCSEMGILVRDPVFKYLGSLNELLLAVYKDAGIWSVVARLMVEETTVSVFAVICDDGGVRFDLKGQFDIHQPDSLEAIRKCIKDRVQATGCASYNISGPVPPLDTHPSKCRKAIWPRKPL